MFFQSDNAAWPDLGRLANRDVIVCSPNLAGTLNQAFGVAEAFARQLPGSQADPPSRMPAIRRHHAFDDIRAKLGTFVPVRAPFCAVSCGRSGERKGRLLKSAFPRLFWTHIETLKEPGIGPDLNAIPAHDWTAAGSSPAIIEMAGVPHRVRLGELAVQRAAARAELGLPPVSQLTVVLIGGPNEAFAYDERLQAAFGTLLAAGTAHTEDRLLIVTSRRTPPEIATWLHAKAGRGVILLRDHPGLDYTLALAAADRLAVTADSISMTCEAVATGKPVYRLELTPRAGARHEKFLRFQDRWKAFVRSANSVGEVWIDPGETPPNDADDVAARMVAMMEIGA